MSVAFDANWVEKMNKSPMISHYTPCIVNLAVKNPRENSQEVLDTISALELVNKSYRGSSHAIPLITKVTHEEVETISR